MEATLNNTPLQKQLPACQLLLNGPLGWVKGTLSAFSHKEKQSSDFHHEKSNTLCTRQWQQWSLGGVIGERLNPYRHILYRDTVGWVGRGVWGSVCPPGHAMASRCSLVCSILNDSFVFLEPINEGARAREAPRRQTGLTFHSFALWDCGDRAYVCHWSIRQRYHPVFPTCTSASSIAVALTVTLWHLKGLRHSCAAKNGNSVIYSPLYHYKTVQLFWPWNTIQLFLKNLHIDFFHTTTCWVLVTLKILLLI